MLTQLPKSPFHMIDLGMEVAHESCILDTMVSTGQPLRCWLGIVCHLVSSSLTRPTVPGYVLRAARNLPLRICQMQQPRLSALVAPV